MTRQQSVFEAIKQRAEQGDVNDQCTLGQTYIYPIGDMEQAVYWLRRAAEQGHGEAQLLLGVRYDRGEGVPRDPVEAARLYRLSAEQGNYIAHHHLGLNYFDGEGVEQDDVQAHVWLSMATNHGEFIDREEERIDALEKRMTPEQLSETKALCSDYIENNTD